MKLNHKPGDLYGINVTCTAANKMARDVFALRCGTSQGIRDVLDQLRTIDDSYTARGSVVEIEHRIA